MLRNRKDFEVAFYTIARCVPMEGSEIPIFSCMHILSCRKSFGMKWSPSTTDSPTSNACEVGHFPTWRVFGVGLLWLVFYFFASSYASSSPLHDNSPSISYHNATCSLTFTPLTIAPIPLPIRIQFTFYISFTDDLIRLDLFTYWNAVWNSLCLYPPLLWSPYLLKCTSIKSTKRLIIPHESCLECRLCRHRSICSRLSGLNRIRFRTSQFNFHV